MKLRRRKPERVTVKAEPQEACRLAPFFPDEPCEGDVAPMKFALAEAPGCARHRQWVQDNHDAAEAMGLV